jgi:amino acid adenylation domain-containing protein
VTVSTSSRDELAASQAFWQAALRGWKDFTRLPPFARTSQGEDAEVQARAGTAWCSLKISTGGCESAAASLNLGLLLTGAWALLLNRMTGEDAALFGIAVGGRQFPIVVASPDEMTFTVFMRTLNDQIARYHGYAAVANSQIRGWSEISGGERLFESIVICGPESVDAVAGSINTPLLLRASRESTSECRLEIVFESGFLEPELAERLMVRLGKLLSAMMANPNRRLGEYSVLTERERRLLVDWNRNEAESDERKCVHQLFDEQADATPGAKAVVFRDQALTYEELNERSERLAAHLRYGLGVGPETVVAICMEPSLGLTVALLGILKAGGAYLPVDPAFPAERISFMLQDSQATVILTQPKLRGRFSGQTAEVMVIDSGLEFAAIEANRLERTAGPHNLAYLMYTSGSTGTPKGVMVEHRNVVNFFAGMDRVVGTEPGVWLSVTTISFDISVLELLWTLTRGFTVVVQAEEDKLIAAGRYSLREQFKRHHVTHLQCTPTLARMLIRLPGVLPAITSLRKLFLGGEPLPASLAQQLGKELTAEIQNMYGPTETTVWSTTFRLGGSERNAIPIGRPIANTSIYILDQHLRMVPVGANGELYIGGKGVARGYWRRPELTAERFISNPFSSDPADRLYKTGDLARYREDGVIEFLGRIDQQVKIRGFRIELGEIESVLGRYPGVREVVVTAAESPSGQQQLIAYLVAEDGWAGDVGELQSYSRRKLPGYMIPAAFVRVDRLATTPNGKVDRKALGGLAKSAEPDRSATDLENTISRVWRDALGLDAVGLQDNFFDLGANSLIVAEVAVDLQQNCNLGVRLADLFAYPTIRALAAHLSGKENDQSVVRVGAQRGTLRREALLKRARPMGARKSGSV